MSYTHLVAQYFFKVRLYAFGSVEQGAARIGVHDDVAHVLFERMLNDKRLPNVKTAALFFVLQDVQGATSIFGSQGGRNSGV